MTSKLERTHTPNISHAFGTHPTHREPRYSTKEISAMLGISQGVISYHMKNKHFPEPALVSGRGKKYYWTMGQVKMMREYLGK